MVMTQIYDPADYIDDIVDRLSSGETLRSIYRTPNYPSNQVIYTWANNDPIVAERIARARELSADVIAETVLDIADDATNDYMEQLAESTDEHEQSKAASWKLNGEHVQRSKLRVEARLKLLAKWQPKKYGERLELEHKGSVNVATDIAALRSKLDGDKD